MRDAKNAGGSSVAVTPAPRLVFSRVPVTDEQCPAPEVFDWFVANVEPATDGQFLLFNCQMGRGRTTSAMVIATLLTFRLSSSQLNLDEIAAAANVKSSTFASVAGETKDKYTDAQIQSFKNGNYQVINRLLRVLENGTQAKAQVDKVMDLCGHMQNLREAVWTVKSALEVAATAKQKQSGTERTRAYLIRYFYMVAFGSFLLSADFGAALETGQTASFRSFLQERPEIENCLASLTFD